VPEHRATKRYADAIYQLAKDKGEESLWDDELGKALVVLHTSKVSQILSHPKLDLAKKWDVLESFFGEGKTVALRRETRNLLKLLLQNKKISLVAVIRERFQASWEQDLGVVSIQLTTAIPLTPAEQETVKTTLGASLRKTIRLDLSVDPSIFGGAIIQIEDRLIDGSLREKVRHMRETLVA